MKVRITACGVFQSALKKLGIYRRFPGIEIEYLQPLLHNYPLQLRDKLNDVVSRASRNGQKVVCLYGNCFPDIDEFLKERAAIRIGCGHCYEMLLGSRSFNRAMEEDPGTYFVEKELIMNFVSYCREPLELDDPQMREWFFERYNTLLYIRQPGDQELWDRACQIAQFLNLRLQLKEADYADLAETLEQKIEQARSVLD